MEEQDRVRAKMVSAMKQNFMQHNLVNPRKITSIVQQPEKKLAQITCARSNSEYITHAKNTFLIMEEFCGQYGTGSKPCTVVGGVFDLNIVYRRSIGNDVRARSRIYSLAEDGQVSWLCA